MAGPFAELFSFRQPDGSEIVLWGEGDEFSAVFETVDGYTVVFNHATKAYHYGLLAPGGAQIDPVGPPVGRVNPATLGLVKHQRIAREARLKQISERFHRWDAGMEVSAEWQQRKASVRAAVGDTSGAASEFIEPAPPSATTTGTKVGLTLLIDFSDDPATIAQGSIIDFCNGSNYTGYGNNGSVRQYFYDNSGGQLDYQNVVTLYIRMAQPKTYYNDTSKGCGDQGNILIRDAIAIMKALPNYATDILPTFNALTVNGGSQVVACNVFYAGGNGGVWSYGLWPHSWSLYNVGAQALGNGKSVYKYQLTNIGSSLALGTFCHENGHMLCGFPDIYDYGYDSYGGAGSFCLMGYGGSGGNPTQICAYLKRAAGWATTVALSQSSALGGSLTSSGTGFNTFYRYQKPGVTTEYYLLENRQKAGRDANLRGAGVFIWHIDESGNRDNQSVAYNTTHANYEVSLVQADNQFHFQTYSNSGDANDPYYLGNTATGYANQFNDQSAPSARWWDGSSSTFAVSDFSGRATTMTFQIGVPGVKVLFSSAALEAEDCVPANGGIDPGETVTVAVTLQNTGNVPTGSLVATLQESGGITSLSAPQTYGVLAGGGGSFSRPFTFTASGACGGFVEMTLHLQDGATDYGMISARFVLGALKVTLSENFDGVTAPALPSGWASSALNAGARWVTSTAQRDGSPNSAYCTDPAAAGYSELVSPALTVTSGAAQLRFRHYYNTESSFDGGVLEIKVGNGGFADIIAAGGSFVSGGYNATLSGGSALAGRSAWSGTSGGFVTTVVNLPAGVAGQTFQLRWALGSDSSVGGTGWYLDTVSVSDRTCCVGGTAILGVSPDSALDAVGSVGGAFEPASIEYTVSNSGTGTLAWTAAADQSWVTISPAAGTIAPGASATVTVSINSAANSLAFGTHNATVSFNDASGGTGGVTRDVVLTVNPVPPVANFSGTPTSGTAPLTVSFTDQSTGSVTGWAWDFGDGATSTARNPSHTYAAAGQFTVALTATGPATPGNSTATRVDYINVSAPAPTAPTGLTATPGNASVTLKWTAVGTATKYYIKRSTSKRGPFETVNTVFSPLTTCTDASLANGTTYYYVVSAVNSTGESPNSSQVSARPTAPPAAPTGLTATAGDAQVTLAWTASSGATGYNVKRSTTSGGVYTTIATPTTTSYVDSTVANGNTYYYVVSAVGLTGEGGNSSEVSATPSATALPSPWVGADIGSPAPAGSSSYNNGAFSITGAGAGIGSGSDQFRYVYQPASGNCAVLARIDSLDSPGKAGVMVRSSLTPNAMEACVLLTSPTVGGATATFICRAANGGTATVVANTPPLPAGPYWVRIVRTNKALTAYTSANGTTWTSFGSTSISMPTSSYIGLAVTSDGSATLTTATMSAVQATP